MPENSPSEERKNRSGYKKWREGYVVKSRNFANEEDRGKVSLFFTLRLGFDYPNAEGDMKLMEAPNAEQELLDNLNSTSDIEWDMWTEEEQKKFEKIMAAYTSLFPEKLMAERDDPAHVAWSLSTYFNEENSVTLDQEEILALSAILKRIGTSLTTEQKFTGYFVRPDFN